MPWYVSPNITREEPSDPLVFIALAFMFNR